MATVGIIGDVARVESPQQKYVRENPEKVKEQQRKYYNTQQGQWKGFEKHLRRMYGITPEDYALLENSQDRKCYLCNTPHHATRDGMLVVDHCHEGGGVRRLLCHHCNSGLGQFKDDPALLRRAADYLEKY